MSKRDISQLLHSLQTLFFRVATLNLHARLNSYRGDGNSTGDCEISGLSEQIDEIAGRASDSVSAADSNTTNMSKEEVRKPVTESSRPRAKKNTLSRGLSGLTKFFRRKRPNYASYSHLTDQLQRSVREHLNTSLRKARQGDVTNAKLHADIAGNALHELARYMPHDEYEKFSTGVSADLKEFRDRDLFRPIVECSH